jgi:hypothetical protein
MTLTQQNISRFLKRRGIPVSMDVLDADGSPVHVAFVRTVRSGILVSSLSADNYRLADFELRKAGYVVKDCSSKKGNRDGLVVTDPEMPTGSGTLTVVRTRDEKRERSAKVTRCTRCQRRCRNPEGWNATLKQGVVVGYLCPDCQTPEENAQAEINEATLKYGRDSFGRVTVRPKT